MYRPLLGGDIEHTASSFGETWKRGDVLSDGTELWVSERDDNWLKDQEYSYFVRNLIQSESGEYLIKVDSDGTYVDDTFLLLYENSFDPDHSIDNLIYGK